MGSVKLMNRVDTKFVTTVPQLLSLLKRLEAGYLMQQIDGKYDMPYFTCYYETADHDMFYQHQRGKKRRQKIRTRLYEGTSELPYLEIKTKDNKGRTKKKRVLMEDGDKLSNYPDFFDKYSGYPHKELSATINNHFYRLTLVNLDLTERITIDTGLEFHNLHTGTIASLPHIGIIEWKRDGLSAKSELDRHLRDLRIHQSGFSKYCMGMALTDESLRHNRLKPKLRLLEKLGCGLIRS